MLSFAFTEMKLVFELSLCQASDNFMSNQNKCPIAASEKYLHSSTNLIGFTSNYKSIT